MKKSIVICSGLFMIIFLFQWFSSELYSILTPFLLIYIYPVILIMIAAMILWSIIFFIKKRKIFKAKAAVPLIISIVMTVVLLFFPFCEAKVWTEFILYTPQREKIVEMIASDQSFTNMISGIVPLPIQYQHLSCDGTVFVEKHTENTLVIGFWVFRGLSVNGYSMVYYTSTEDESTFQYLIEDDITTITKLNSKWYYVVTD